MVGLPAYTSEDYGAYPTKCSEGRDVARVYQTSSKTWLSVHQDDGTTCEHALDHTTAGTSSTRALATLLGLV